MPVVDAAALRALMRDLLVAAGCSEAAGIQTAEALLEADLRGYAFEGCRHLPALVRDLRAGRVNARARPRIVEERPASALVDGDGGPAPVGGSFAVDVAVRKAGQAGCCAVGLVNTDPLYMLGYFGERLARAGLVGIIGSAGRPRVHPPGGVDPILGTNPLTIAIPSAGDAPLIVDFATSRLAFGFVLEAERRGQRLPEGVAIGPDGHRTCDPAVAIVGGDWTDRLGHGTAVAGVIREKAPEAEIYAVKIFDRRLSANNYRALWAAQEKLAKGGFIKATFDVNKHIEPKYIVKLMRERPELFSDLPPIPANVAIGPGFVFKP